MRKKISSFLLTLCIVLAWMPTTMTAYASEPHSHCICGASHTTIGNHTDADVKDFTAWNETNSLPTKAGNYYLTDNVTISSTWEPVGNTILCLNGKTITCTGDVDAITINSGVSFTLTDCKSGSEMGKITHENEKNGRGIGMDLSLISPSTFTMYGGNITGNKTTEGGGGVYVGSYSTFNMYGGSISSNTATGNGGGVNAGTSCTLALYGGSISGNTTSQKGGGVSVSTSSTFTMYNGSITGNMASREGGGVYNSGIFTMKDGSIKDNTTTNNGGGVYLFSNTFTMEGGSITGNKAAKGGGAYIWGTFNMSGGSITGNTALQEGGGVHTWSSYNFTISGNVNISSNNKTTSGETTTDNVYLDLGRKITIGGALAGTSKIGVNRSWSTSDSSVDITGTNETDYSRNFTSDDTDYEIYYDVNSQIIKIKAKSSEHTEHDWKYSANGAVLTASCDKKAICQEADKTLTLSAASPVYSGNAATINIGTTEERMAWEAAGFTLPTVVEHYNGATMLNSAPTTAGTYTAKVTYNGVTASVNYTITDRTPAITTHTITATAGANGSITPSGAVEVNAGTNQAFTITPNEGYEIDTLKVDGSDVTAVNGYTFLDVTVDHTIAVTFKQISQTPDTPDTPTTPDTPDTPGTPTTPDVPTTQVEYNVIEGTNGTHIINVDGSYTIRANGDFSKFVNVEVDGKTVDSSNYTAKSGSTIITFTESYMNSLSVGTHTIKLNYTDGFASTGITIAKNEASDENISEPSTGDVHPIGWLFVLFLASGISLVSFTVIKIKQDK